MEGDDEQHKKNIEQNNVMAMSWRKKFWESIDNLSRFNCH